MTSDDLAATHAAAFGEERAWSADSFERYIRERTTLVMGDATCFAVIRLAGPEAEILTLATHPKAQGQGLAKALVHEIITHLRAVGVEELFLDVATDNTIAIHVYASSGFIAFGERKNYYKDGTTAICMKVRL